MISGIFYLACVAGIAYYADTKGRSPIVWGLVAVLTTPLLTLIILAFLKNLKDEQNLQQVLNQQEQINDRISVNEINNNRHFEQIERDVKKLEERERAGLESVAPMTLGGAIDSSGSETKPEAVEAEVIDPFEKANPEIADTVEMTEQPRTEEVDIVNQSENVEVAAAAANKCPYCESVVPVGSKFCGNCGAKL